MAEGSKKIARVVLQRDFLRAAGDETAGWATTTVGGERVKARQYILLGQDCKETKCDYSSFWILTTLQKVVAAHFCCYFCVSI